MTITMPTPQRTAARDDPGFYGGDIYDSALSRAKRTARTRDGGRALLAGRPEELRGLTEAGAQAQPARPWVSAEES